MFLLDSDVIAAVRRWNPNGAVLDWLTDVPVNQLHISAVSVGEIQLAIENMQETDRPGAQQLQEWLLRLRCAYGVLPADAVVFRQWGRLMHKQPDASVEVSIVAATAVIHGLTVATGDVETFEPFGVPTFNPFEFRR